MISKVTSHTLHTSVLHQFSRFPSLTRREIISLWYKISSRCILGSATVRLWCSKRAVPEMEKTVIISVRSACSSSGCSSCPLPSSIACEGFTSRHAHMHDLYHRVPEIACFSSSVIYSWMKNKCLSGTAEPQEENCLESSCSYFLGISALLGVP